jgi:hypothetical protein
LSGRGSLAAYLDEAAELVVRQVPEWAAVLALSALPWRLLEVHFANRLMQLGGRAADYFDHLLALSSLVSVALLPALWGRAVFVRACVLGLQARARVPARLVLRLPVAAFIGYAYAALVWSGLFQAMAWTVVLVPILALGSGLTAATAPLAGEAARRPGPLASLGLALRAAPRPMVGVALAAIFALACGVAFVNLLVLFELGLWLAGGIPGLDLAAWSLALGLGNRHFLLLVLAGAVTVVEPFWLAALVVAVRAARARESGEDLFARFAELRAGGGGGGVGEAA